MLNYWFSLVCSEIWLPCVGYEDFYSISNYGRIKRIKVVAGCRAGRILKLSRSTNGYSHIMLSSGSRESQKCHRVHSLVAGTFLGDRPIGYQVNHIDANKLNNSLFNLEYVTPKKNREHAKALGLYPKGEEVSLSHFTVFDVIEIRRLYTTGLYQYQIAEMFQCSQSTVGRIVRRQVWSHI